MSIKVEQYIINTDNILGKGQFGIVYDCSHPQIKEEICAKIVKTNSMDNKLITRESQILQELRKVNNPNLVRIYDVIPAPEKKELYIIMEKCKGGDLKQDIERRSLQNEPYSITEVISIITQIINGYRTLFDQKIIHRDMKPANILIENGKIKITDFGMGRVIEDMNKQYPHTKVGTPAYASPQLYLEPNYSSKSDIYSLGIILHQLAFLKLPFTCRSQQELIIFLRQLRDEPFACKEITIKGDPKEQDRIRKLIDQMLIYNEEQRISWEKLFEIFCQTNVENNKIQQTPVKEEELLYDSMFIRNFSSQKQMFNPKIFQQVSNNFSKDNQITRTSRLNHLVNLFLAKARLASQLTWVMVELRKNELSSLNDLNYYLIQTCLIGYRYKIVQNAYGFSQNVLELICDEVRHFYNADEIQNGLSEYIQDQSEYSKLIRNQVLIDRDDSSAQFKYIESILIDHKKRKSYPADINNFYRLINVEMNTEYKIYGKWFSYFYKKELKEYCSFQETKTYSPLELKFFALTQMFLKVEEEFSYQRYLELDPRQVCLPDDADRAQFINIIKKYGQK